jgi:hypothetical protein
MSECRLIMPMRIEALVLDDKYRAT